MVALVEQAVFLNQLCFRSLPVPDCTGTVIATCATGILIILAAHEVPFARSGSASGVDSPLQSTGSTEFGSLRMLSMSAFPTAEQFTFSEKVSNSDCYHSCLRLQVELLVNVLQSLVPDLPAYLLNLILSEQPAPPRWQDMALPKGGQLCSWTTKCLQYQGDPFIHAR